MKCATCVLEENKPLVSLNDKGICDECLSHKKYVYKGEQALVDILDAQKKKGGKYECAVTLSGGRDSTYTLLKLVKDYKMKVLAINYDNPFTDPQARANIQNAVEKLGVDLVSFRIKGQIHERTFKNNMLAWFKDPSPGMVPMMCIACKTFWGDILRVAKKNRISLIVSGNNPFEDTSFKKKLLGVKSNESNESEFMKATFGIVKRAVHNPSYFKPVCIPTTIKGYLFGDPYTLGSRIYGHNIKRIDLFYYIPWDEREVLSRIRSEVGWDSPKRFKSTWRWDCKVASLKDLMYIMTINMMEKDDFYAKIVREGLMTRDEVLRRLPQENEIHWDDIRDVLAQVGIHDFSFMEEVSKHHPKFWPAAIATKL